MENSDSSLHKELKFTLKRMLTSGDLRSIREALVDDGFGRGEVEEMASILDVWGYLEIRGKIYIGSYYYWRNLLQDIGNMQAANVVMGYQKVYNQMHGIEADGDDLVRQRRSTQQLNDTVGKARTNSRAYQDFKKGLLFAALGSIALLLSFIPFNKILSSNPNRDHFAQHETPKDHAQKQATQRLEAAIKASKPYEEYVRLALDALPSQADRKAVIDKTPGKRRQSAIVSVAREEGSSLSILKYLVETGGADVNKRSSDGETALWWACKRGDLEMVQFLVTMRASKDSADTAQGLTPLMVASVGGHTLVVRYLLEQGAQVDLADKSGYTALHYGAGNGYMDIVRALNTGKASIDKLTSIGSYTPLAYALYMESFDDGRKDRDYRSVINYLQDWEREHQSSRPLS